MIYFRSLAHLLHCMKFTYHTHIHTGGIVLLCHQCNYKWKRPEGEPMSKPCPKCQTPIRVG